MRNHEVRRTSQAAQVVVFMALAVGLGAAWAHHASSSGMLHSPQTAGQAAWIAQLTVLLATVITLLVFDRKGFRTLGWHMGPARAYAAVVGITIATIGVATLLGLLLHALSIAPHVRAGQTAFLLAFLFVFSTLFAFGEEIGWRGFLLPRLLPLGVHRALLLSGLLWFVWELPLVLFGLLDTTLLPINAPLTLCMHLLQDVAVGVLFGYLRLRFNSLVLPTFAHGLLNTMGAVAVLFLSERKPLIGDFSGVIGTILVVALACIVFRLSSRLHAGQFPQQLPSHPAGEILL